MKRFLPVVLIAGAALAGTLLLRPAALVGQAPACRTSAPPCCHEECGNEKDCCPAAKTGKTDAVVVAELVTILDHTKSADTYLVTLLALSQFEDRSPLPAVVRNAARLGLLKGLSKKDNPTQAQQMIGAYLSGEMSVETKLTARQFNGPSGYGYYAYPPPMPAPPPITYTAPLRAPAVSLSCGSSTPMQQFVPAACPTPERLGPPRCVPVDPPVSTSESEAPSAKPTKMDVDFGSWYFFGVQR